MTHSKHHARILRLCASASTIGLFVALATPAAAQDAAAQAATPPAADAPQDAAPDQGADIVVTGTLFRRTNSETPSPVTTLKAEDLRERGITTVADAIRTVSADNSGSIPTAFAAGFGSGSAGVSLRGLTVNSTLVLIDGIRTTNYPYADDGQRSFVDLNSIPQSTIDRVEVLKDGASSTYGADAIGGVVNIITRREVKGVEGTVEAGISQRGDAGEQRATLTAGYGDLSEQGFNVYLNGEYQHDDFVSVNDRGFPYNTTDLSSIGGDDNNYGAGGAFGTRFGAISAVVGPAREATPGSIFSGVRLVDGEGNPLATRILNPAGCANGTFFATDATGPHCEENPAPYNTIQPEQTRYGFTGRATVKIGGSAEAYLSGTYFHSDVFSRANPSSVRQQNPINTRNIVLPALLSNGTVNPYNPYAVAGCVEGVTCVDAALSYAFGDLPVSFHSQNNVYRAAAGVHGDFGGDWTYAVDATYAKSTLVGTNTGLLNIAGLTNAINNGTYNFINPSLNSQAVRDSISPAVSTTARSELYMIQGVVTKKLFELPGGPLELGIGGSARHESLNNPNANANNATLGLNAVTAAGHHTVTAAYFELNAPVFDQLEIDASGRYDHYSDGYSHFSPKIGAKFTPIPQLAIRGTFSKGFRAPTFAEKNQGAVIGYTATTPPQSVIDAHHNDAYVNAYALGFNSASNPNIKPELSRSFTGGVVFQPTPWLSFTADYYNIKKSQVISAGPQSGEAVNDYYTGQPLPAGYTLTLDDPDPLFPNAIRKILIVNSPYANASELKTSGIDVSVLAQFHPTGGIKFSSQLEVTEILNYDFQPSAGKPFDHYVGTQAPYVLSSGAGTPRWRGNWQNTLEAGPLTVSATAYYTSGYKAVAEDQSGHDLTSCADNLYDGSLPNFYCHTKRFIDVDMVASFKVNDQFRFYVNVYNLFDAAAPLNPDNYAAFNYNPTWSQQGIIGRSFRAGASFKF